MLAQLRFRVQATAGVVELYLIERVEPRILGRA